MRYGTGPEVLRDVSFTLEPGTFHFLTGASGAGKSSLLRLMYLAHRPSRGLITMFGHDVGVAEAGGAAAAPAPHRRRVPELPPARPPVGAGQRALPLRVAGAKEGQVREHVAELLSWVGLGDHLNDKPATLSGGQQQRVAIARAVITRPSLLLADEPTGNVDDGIGMRLLHLFEELNKLGTTIVIATHNEMLIERFGYARMVLDKGVLQHLPRSTAAPDCLMFRTHYDLPLQRDVTGRFLPWIIALMVYLAIWRWPDRWSCPTWRNAGTRGLGRHPDHSGPAPARRHAPTLDTASRRHWECLHATPGISKAEPLKREQMAPPGALAGQRRAHRQPAGAGADRRDHGRRRDRCARVGSTPARRRPGVEVDDHAAWLKDVLAIAQAVEMVALGVVALVSSAGRHGDFRVAGRAGDPRTGGRAAACHGRPRPLRRASSRAMCWGWRCVEGWPAPCWPPPPCSP